MKIEELVDKYVLDTHLSDYRQDLTLDELLTILNDSETHHTSEIEDVSVWAPLEDMPPEELAETMENARTSLLNFAKEIQKISKLS